MGLRQDNHIPLGPVCVEYALEALPSPPGELIFPMHWYGDAVPETCRWPRRQAVLDFVQQGPPWVGRVKPSHKPPMSLTPGVVGRLNRLIGSELPGQRFIAV